MNATEFAIVAPILLTLLFGTIDFGIAMYTYEFVSYSAQMGARYACVRGATSPTPVAASDVSTYVKSLASGARDPASYTVTTTWNPDNHPGSTVTVQVSCTFTPLTSLVPKVSLQLSRTASMVISQ
ncbi:MAG TPA: TadE/TadG family type IV pilus assembly protein [Candidatus Binataceae bacterium]|nr:TadE/TadG family type IV pilus assembly protein [Candidatus Binataceae bacterium]